MTRFAARLMMLPLVVVALLLAACDGGVDVPATPDAAVLRVSNGIAANKPVVIWQALPESYQKDVHELVHSAIAKVDAELYNEVASTAQQLVKVLKEKKQFILAHPMVAQQMPNKAEVEKQWDQIVGMLDNILNSQLSKHETAKTMNVGEFLDDTGSKVMGDLANAAKLAGGPGEKPGEANEFVEMYEKLKKTKASVVKQEGDTATVKIEVPGEEVTEEQFVRVEGKWIPKEMADEWKGMMTEARAQIAAMDPAQMKDAKEMAMPVLASVKTMLGSLEKAKTQEEFNKSVNNLMQLIGGGGAAPPSGDDF